MDFLHQEQKVERQKKWQERKEDKNVNFVYGRGGGGGGGGGGG